MVLSIKQLSFVFVSVSIFVIQVVSLKSATALFGLDHRFILISLAASGLGFGALFYYLLIRKRCLLDRSHYSMFLLTSLMTAFLFLPYIFYAIDLQPSITLYFGLLLALYSVIGFILTKVFYEHVQSFSLYYAIHSFGLGVGLLMVMFLIPSGYLVLAMIMIGLSLALSFLEMPTTSQMKIVLAGITVLVVAGAVYHLRVTDADVTLPCKDVVQNHRLLATKDNLFSHIRLSRKGAEYISVYGCVRRTSALEFTPKSQEILAEDFYAIPYEFTSDGRGVILGGGIGIESARAIAGGYHEVIPIEINRDAINAINSVLQGSKNIYNHPNVYLIIGEARRELSKLDGQFDLIYIPHSGRYGVFGINSFNSVPNYLYTEEAMSLYYDKLSDDGIFATAEHGYFVHFNVETLVHTLRTKGVQEGEIISIRTIRTLDDLSGVTTRAFRKSWNEWAALSERSLLLYKKNGFTESELEHIADRLDHTDKMSVISFDKSYELDNSLLTTDDRPYYSAKQIFADYDDLNEYIYTDDQRGVVRENIIPTILQSYIKLSLIPLMLTIMTIAYFIHRRRSTVLKLSMLKVSTFFTLLGTGFMLLELGYLNSLFLVLDSPILSFSLLLFIFIFFSGLGSLVGHYYEKTAVRKFRWLAASLLILAIPTVLYTYEIVNYAINATKIIQIMILTVIAGVPAFVTGIVFPVATKLVSVRDKTMLIYVYLLDSFVTVLAGIIALIVSTVYGFSVLLISGAVCYFLAILLWPAVKEYNR